MAGDPRFPPIQPGQDLTPWDASQMLARGRPVGTPVVRGPTLPGYGGALVAPGGGSSSSVGGIITWVAMAHQYAKMINGVFPAGLTSVKIIDEPTSYRNFLMFRNPDATAKLYIGFGQDASIANSTLILNPGVMVLFDSVVPQDDLYVISDTAGKTVNVMYSTVALPEQPLA